MQHISQNHSRIGEQLVLLEELVVVCDTVQPLWALLGSDPRKFFNERLLCNSICLLTSGFVRFEEVWASGNQHTYLFGAQSSCL